MEFNVNLIKAALKHVPTARVSDLKMPRLNVFKLDNEMLDLIIETYAYKLLDTKAKCDDYDVFLNVFNKVILAYRDGEQEYRKVYNPHMISTETVEVRDEVLLLKRLVKQNLKMLKDTTFCQDMYNEIIECSLADTVRSIDKDGFVKTHLMLNGYTFTMEKYKIRKENTYNIVKGDKKTLEEIPADYYSKYRIFLGDSDNFGWNQIHHGDNNTELDDLTLQRLIRYMRYVVEVEPDWIHHEKYENIYRIDSPCYGFYIDHGNGCSTSGYKFNPDIKNPRPVEWVNDEGLLRHLGYQYVYRSYSDGRINEYEHGIKFSKIKNETNRKLLMDAIDIIKEYRKAWAVLTRRKDDEFEVAAAKITGSRDLLWKEYCKKFEPEFDNLRKVFNEDDSTLLYAFDISEAEAADKDKE